MAERSQVYAAIDKERHYQDVKWGTLADHPHEVGGWLTILRNKMHDADTAWCGRRGDELALCEILQIAAVAVACLEQHALCEAAQ